MIRFSGISRYTSDIIFIVFVSSLFKSCFSLIASSDAAYAENVVKFKPPCSNHSIPGRCFDFGFANAPAQVEDDLDDAWIEFAMSNDTYEGKKGPVRAFRNAYKPEQRLGFWSQPEIELNLANNANADVFRMGIDWGRLVPFEPINRTKHAFNYAAADHYKKIMKRIKDKNMRIMLTLFHHSLPKWAVKLGGWTNKITAAYFSEFSKLAVTEFNEFVDYWITFNEPTVFVSFTYCLGTWPPGDKKTQLESAICFSPIGNFTKAMKIIGEAHISTYKILKKSSNSPIGIAHNVGIFRPLTLSALPLVLYADWLFLFSWIDQIILQLDFCGINYYGEQDFISFTESLLSENEEYSEIGIGVYPDGLFHLLMIFHFRYNSMNKNLRYIITENGISDSTDIIRQPYLIEHLIAINAAIQQGVPVDGYLHWTISDNWEWTEGYCPKFGIVSVQRENNLKRTPHPTYDLFKKIVKSRQITPEQRDLAWESLKKHAQEGKNRTFCRAVNSRNILSFDSLDVAIEKRLSKRDWRFGHYKESKLGNETLKALYILAKSSSLSSSS